MKSLSNFVTSYLSLVTCFHRWHPEVAIRYLPIIQEVHNSKFIIQNSRILEVGSGWLGISPYLGRQVTGLDEDFEGKKFSLLKQVTGSVLKIPFKDNSFGSVIGVDVLEHLPKNQRPRAMSELLRVAGKQVFIGVPCGKKSLRQDVELDKIYQITFKKQFEFLKDHLSNGLPEEKQVRLLIESAAKKNGKKVETKIQGNENLDLRMFLMKGWITKNPITDFIFRKVFLLLIPFFPLVDKPPYYRKLFFVTIKS